LVLIQEGAPGTHKTTCQIASETGILQRSVGRIIHKDIQRKCLKKRYWHGRESNTPSRIKQLIGGEIVLMRVSKPKANTLNICCDVFVGNCQFVMFNACITVVMNSLTRCVSESSVNDIY